MSTITGTLISIESGEDPGGSVDIALCGYGNQFPRAQGTTVGSFCEVGVKNLQATSGDSGDSGEGFSVDLVGNDLITPAGTYYTITTKNSNGDVVQCNAYIFEDALDYNMDTLTPFDPSYTPPAAIEPPSLINLLQIIAFSAAPLYDGEVYPTFQITLTADVTSGTVEHLVDGNLYTFIIEQDGSGGHAFVWPAACLNATPVNPEPSSTTIQTFVAAFGLLYPIGAGTWN